MKHYAGLDVSMNSTNICVIDDSGKIVRESACNTEPSCIAEQLQPFASSMEIVGLEAGMMCFWLVDGLQQADLPAVCLDSRKVANILSTTINKTDKNDARGIAQILRSGFFTTVHLRSAESIDVGLLMKLRSGLVQDRVCKKNRIRGLLKSFGIRISTCGNGSFIKAVREAIVGLNEGTKIPIEIAIDDYANAEETEKKMDEQVRIREKVTPVAALLQTADGIGPITALSFIAEIDDPSRFRAKPENIGAYLGLTPKQYSSGESVRLGKISKSGSPFLRSLLYEAAVTLLTKTKRWSSLKSWGLRLAKRTSFKLAATAVARRLSVILLKMWLRGETFRYSNPEKENIARKNKNVKNLPISSEQSHPIVAGQPVCVKAKPCGLASLGLDPHAVCPA